MHIGLQLVRPQQLRIDFDRPIDFSLRFRQIVILNRQRRQRRMHFGRIGIDRRRLVELLRRIGLVEFFQIQHSGIEMGRPIVFIKFDQIGIKIVHQKLELIAQPIPPGILRRPQADEPQRIGIGDFVGAIVVIDQPFVAVVGFLQAAGADDSIPPTPNAPPHCFDRV